MKFVKRYLIGAFVLLFGISIVSLRCAGQTNNWNKKELNEAGWFVEPFSIVSVTSGFAAERTPEKSELGKDLRRPLLKFESDDPNWLQGLRLKIKNNSGKAVTYMSVGLEFPETASTGNIMDFTLSYGTHPMDMRENEKVAAVKDGDFIELSMDDAKCKALKSFIETRQALFTLNKVEIRIGFTVFDDGTAWLGEFLHRDPDNPRRWTARDTIHQN